MTPAELWWQSGLRRKARLWLRLGELRWRAPPEEDDTPRRADSLAQAVFGRILSAATLVVVSGFVAVAFAEVALRVPALPLPRDLRTWLFQCYAPEYEGARVSYFSRALGVTLLKPSFHGTCCWSGYLWDHRTDRWGFRNPESWDHADVVLLGDSMIYGHGVEEDQTVAHFLREDLHTTVANLAFMGDALPEELAVLQNFGLRRSPKVAIVFVFHNDLDDIAKRKEADPRRLIETGQAREARVLPEAQLLAEVPAAHPSLGARLKHAFLTYRTAEFYLTHRSGSTVTPARFTAEYPVLPDLPRLPPAPKPAEALAIEYLRAGFHAMKLACEKTHTRLVVAYLPALYEPDGRVDRLVFYQAREIAADEELPFLDATGAMVDEQGRLVAGSRLEYDGHLAEVGHRRLAELVTRFVRERRLLE